VRCGTTDFRNVQDFKEVSGAAMYAIQRGTRISIYAEVGT